MGGEESGEEGTSEEEDKLSKRAELSGSGLVWGPLALFPFSLKEVGVPAFAVTKLGGKPNRRQI